MKLGQLASQYSDVLPPALAEQLKLLQREAKPLPYEEIEPLLAAQWTPAQRRKVAHIEPVALAAASIGQVHRARLKDGSAVVVKLRYPGVREAVDADLSQLRRLISASKLLPIDDEAMDRVMVEVRERFREETDYAAELANLNHLRAQTQVPGIVYAKPYPGLCTDGVLVLSEEPGKSLEVAEQWPEHQRRAIALTISRWIMHSLFETRAVHADPHPGNFAFREDGSVVVYDMGCVKNVPDVHRAGGTATGAGGHRSRLDVTACGAHRDDGHQARHRALGSAGALRGFRSGHDGQVVGAAGVRLRRPGVHE